MAAVGMLTLMLRMVLRLMLLRLPRPLLLLHHDDAALSLVMAATGGCGRSSGGGDGGNGGGGGGWWLVAKCGGYNGGGCAHGRGRLELRRTLWCPRLPYGAAPDRFE